MENLTIAFTQGKPTAASAVLSQLVQLVFFQAA